MIFANKEIHREPAKFLITTLKSSISANKLEGSTITRNLEKAKVQNKPSNHEMTNKDRFFFIILIQRRIIISLN